MTTIPDLNTAIHPSHHPAPKNIGRNHGKPTPGVYCTTCLFWLAWKPNHYEHYIETRLSRDKCTGEPNGPA